MANLHTFRVEVSHDRNTKRMSLYKGDIGSIFGSGIYLNTDQLKQQQFGGKVPTDLTINITGTEPA